MRKFQAVSVLFVPFFFAACGRQVPAEYSGYIARVNGELVRVSEEEKDQVCQTAECEKNYIYSASFGKKPPKPKPKPSPSPTVRPTPTPSPTTTPTGPKENLDYSKSILKLQDAWKISQGSQDVVVAVVDTGVEVTHPDLARNIWVNQAELNGKPGVDDDGDGFVDDVYGYDFANDRPNGIDDNGHGTHVAGIIGAELNGIGTVGVSPHVKIMPVKFLSADGSGDTLSAVKAIDYAVAHGAQIISNSWGGGGNSPELNAAIQRARAKGILVVAAAGNESSDNDSTPSYPASYEGVISVASTTSTDALSSFSNFGSSVFIAAPGSSIYSTYLGASYKVLSGTSMATPQVSGALALALAVNNRVASADLTKKLCDSSDRILTQYVRCGRMNVLSLLQSLQQ